jgi:IclR family acetate operon transcriptional repressor
VSLESLANGAESSPVKSARRVLDILEHVAAATAPVRMTDIVRDLSVPKSSAHALIRTLLQSGYLVDDGDRGYRLGLKVFELGSAVDRTKALVDAAHPVLMRTTAETGCTTNLGILDGHDVYYIDKVQHRDTLIQVVTRVGGRLPFYATAMGKVLLGSLDIATIDSILGTVSFRKLGPGTITDRDSIRAQIMQAKAVGFAVDDEESHPNVVCVAAAVRNETGSVTASVSITGLKSDMIVDGEFRLVPSVIEMARTVSHALR